MKKITSILTTGAMAITMCSCVGLRKMPEYPPISAEVAENMVPYKGMLPVKLAFSIPEEYVNLNTGIQICPTIALPDGSKVQELPKMVVEGAIHDRFNERMGVYKPVYNDSITQRLRYIKGTNSYLYEAEIPYESWFANAVLTVSLAGDAYTKQVPLGELTVGSSVRDFSAYIDRTPLLKFFFWNGPDKEELIKSGANEGQISQVIFPLSFADIKEKKGHEELNNYLNVLFTHPEIKYYKVDVTVANSPEGSLQFNQDLGQERKAAVEEYLAALNIPQDKCNYNMIDEDWEGMLNGLDALDLRHVNEIRDAVSTIADPDEREKYIRRNYSAEWGRIVSSIFPDLRRADIVITAYFKGKDGFVKGKDGFTFEQNPLIEAYELHNQLLDAVKDKDYLLAAEIADKMDSRNLPEKVLANKGTVYLMNQRNEEASLLLERASSIPEARYNLGLAYLLQERYAEAEKAFEGCHDLNAAIVKMSLGKYQTALDMLRMLPASAERDELMAIAKKEVESTSLYLKH